MSIIIKGLGGLQIISQGFGETSNPCDYIAQGGCVCGGEAEFLITQTAPIVEWSVPAISPKPRKNTKPRILSYEAEGGSISGGKAEASIVLAYEATGGAINGGSSVSSIGRRYTAQGGSVSCGETEAEALIDYTDDEIVLMLMMVAEGDLVEA